MILGAIVRLFALTVTFMMSAICVSYAASVERVALVIGNADYRHERLLRTPRNDAKSVAEALTTLGFDVTLAFDLDERALGDTLAAYHEKSRGAAISLFYYSGHGMEVDGTNYIIPTDAMLNRRMDAKLHAVELNDVLESIGGAATLSLAILDACRNNFFGDGKGGAFGGMSKSTPLPGQVIGYSTAPDSLAFEGSGDLSPYTRAFLERVMDNPREDVRIMLSSLTRKTQEYAGREQIPYVEIGSFPEGTVSLLHPDPLVLAADPPPSIGDGLTDWEYRGLVYQVLGDKLDIRIPETPEHVWQSGIYRRNTPMQKDATYVIQFEGRSDEPRPILFWIGHRPNGEDQPFETVTSYRFDLEPEPNRFEFAFTSPVTTKDAQVTFQFGQTDVNLEMSSIELTGGEIAKLELAEIKDCEECPEMLVVPSGSYLRGADFDDATRSKSERPQAEVSVPAFALAKNEVTVGEFRAFAEETGLGQNPCWIGSRSDWTLDENISWAMTAFDQSDDHPITCVSYVDAVKYVDWLNVKSGADLYRLPTEAEWEYAARANTRTPYFTGHKISPDYANYNFDVAKTVATGKLPSTVSVFEVDAANPWGLRHMLGNVYEWTSDCYLEDHKAAPLDGSASSAENGGDCNRRALRGGSMIDDKWGLAVTYRYGEEKHDRLFMVGFRVARDLQ